MLSGLYVIADAGTVGNENFIEKTSEAISAGVNLIQYRDKINSIETRKNFALTIQKLCRKNDATFIVNDDIKLAKSIDAQGVHIGKHDMSLSDARKLLGPHKIIGASCYNEYDRATFAANNGADYIAFGSFFSSATKPNAPVATIELLLRAKRELAIPICAIGGITLNNATTLLDAKADMIAVINAIYSAPSVSTATRLFQTLINDNS